MGCYVEGIAKDTVGGKDVTAHIFEYDRFHLEFQFSPYFSPGIPPMLLLLRREKCPKELALFKYFFASKSRTRRNLTAIGGSSMHSGPC